MNTITPLRLKMIPIPLQRLKDEHDYATQAEGDCNYAAKAEEGLHDIMLKGVTMTGWTLRAARTPCTELATWISQELTTWLL
jgi:hypothetical protein